MNNLFNLPLLEKQPLEYTGKAEKGLPMNNAEKTVE